jgi:hypothetical protein
MGVSRLREPVNHKHKQIGLVQHNGFSPAFLHRMLRMTKAMANLTLAVVDWLSPGGLTLESLRPFTVPISVLLGKIK